MPTSCVHPSNETLETYAMRRLSEHECAPLEEHFLICPACQDRLAAVDEDLEAIRIAARRVLDKANRSSLEGWRPPRVARIRWPRAVAWAGVLAVFTVALAVTVTDRAAKIAESPVVEVGLTSARGLDSDSLARVRVSDRIVLKIDLTELPKSPSYGLEIAAATGKQVWKSRVKAVVNQVVAPVQGLLPGTYWVRLSDEADPPNLLREYGLVVE